MYIKRLLVKIWLVISSLFPQHTHADAQNITLESFVQHLVKEWHKQSGVEHKFTVDYQEGVLKMDDMMLNIHSLYRAYEKAEFTEQWIQEFVRINLNLKKDIPEFDDIKNHIFPLVRSTKWFETQNCYLDESLKQLGAEAEKLSTSYREFNTPFLSVGMIIAHKEHESEIIDTQLQTICDHDLEKWGKTYDELLERAAQNIGAKQYAFHQMAPGVWGLGDNWESDGNLMFFPQAFKQLSLKGEVVVMHPNKGWVIATGSEDIEGLKAMFEIADELMQDRAGLAGYIFRLKDDKWELYTPDIEHPLYEEIAIRNLSADVEESILLAHAIQTILRYNDDKKPYVAKLMLEKEALATGTVLLNKQKSILPIANVIILDVFPETIDDDIFNSCVIPFKKFIEVLEHRISDCPYSQDYFCFEGFPTHQELIQLGVKTEYIPIQN